MAKYTAVFTTYGTQVLAKAIANNQPLRVTHFAVGDGNGREVTVSASQERLVNEKHRATISAVSLDPRNNKQVIFELTIPEDIGGFYIREMGIFDANNKLVAYANCPESFKPTLASGSGKVQVMRMILLVASSNAVTLTVDDSVIFVTRGQLTPKDITANSENGFDHTGHSHAIDKASTTKAGIVQLTSDTGLESENLGLTAKAGKLLAQGIAALRLALNNYIPLKSRSSSVTSNDENGVATPKAVKTAYDKGVDAKQAADGAQRTANDGVAKANAAQNSADNAQQTAEAANRNANTRVAKSGDTMTGDLSLKQGDYSGLNVYNNDGYYTRLEGNPHNANSLLTLAYRTPQGANMAVVSLPKKNGTIAYVDDVVLKSGGAMTGILRTVGIASTHFGAGVYSNQYTSGAPFMVEAVGSQDRDTYHPFVKGLVRSKGRYGAGFSLGYTTKQGQGDGFGRGIIHLIEDNGANRLWAFEHNGDFNSAGDVRSSSGKSLNNSVQTSDYRSQWGQTGWVKLPNGLILQWGKTPVVHDENSTDIVFPIAFPNKVLNIQLTENQMRTVAAHATHLAALNVTNSKFTFKINSTLPIDSSADWFAIGY